MCESSNSSRIHFPHLGGGVSLLDGQRVWPGDGQLVEEHQELAEGLKEGPARQQADALVGVDGPVGDHLLLHGGEHAQLDLLLLAQQLHGIRLVELDGRPVHLRADTDTSGRPVFSWHACRQPATAHLLPGRDGQDERGEDRKGVPCVRVPTLNLGAHWQTEERDRF